MAFFGIRFGIWYEYNEYYLIICYFIIVKNRILKISFFTKAIYNSKTLIPIIFFFI